MSSAGGQGGQGNRPATFGGGGQGQQVVAPGANRSGLVLFLGLGLIGVNMFADPAVRSLGKAATTNPLGGAFKAIAPAPGTPNLVDIGVQVGFVLLLAGVAAVNDEAGSLAVAILIGLWLVFLVMRVDVISGVIQWIGAKG